MILGHEVEPKQETLALVSLEIPLETLDFDEEKNTDNRKLTFRQKTLYIIFIAPAVFDGIGFAALSLSQLISTCNSLDIADIDPTNLSKLQYLAPLLVLPLAAGIGIYAIGRHENDAFVTQQIEDASGKSNLKYAKDKFKDVRVLLNNHFAETLCLSSAALVDGVIIFASLQFLYEQFGHDLDESPFYYPSGAVKFSLDWFYMPAAVSADEITLRQSLLTALNMGLVSTGYYGSLQAYNLIKQYDHLTELNKNTLNNRSSSVQSNSALLHQEQIRNEIHVTEISNSNKTNEEKYVNQKPTTRQFLGELAFTGLITAAVTVTTELLTRYLFLNNSSSDEAEDRLNNAQVIGAIFGGATAIYGIKAFKKVIQYTKSSSWFSFFKGNASAEKVVVEPQNSIMLIEHLPLSL